MLVFQSEHDLQVSQETLLVDPPPSYQVQRTCTPNVLIVGETGVGKSSVINLIAGEKLADVSSSATGCTLDATSYDVVLTDRNGQGHHVRLFDTVGMNEPSLSKNDYFVAIEKANVLINQLLRTGGIRLLIFCIRGGRITSVTQSNYHLFRDILCQNQVPVAFVITGMENEQPMEGWWTRNAALFERSNLSCTSHACVTATPGFRNVYAKQYQASQITIHSMLLDHMSKTSWTPERAGWFIHLAGKLLKWVTKLKDRKRHLPGRSRALTVEELARHLEDKCNFTPEEAVGLAGKIWAKRTEHSETDLVKGEDAGDH
ncbi:P-loop containing nucleoside triphosphate hydrolase protein [Boletus edulis]|nr:P-loop containing nucleoside triphosphate hydrolase protein [Boletus edulis]